MHELTATQHILDTALQQAQAAGGQRILNLHVVVGQVSTMADEAVQFYFDMLSPGTLAEGARLHFRHVPAELLCLICRHRYQPAQAEVACPECRSTQVKVVAGEEFYLEAIDVEPVKRDDKLTA
jgi:hydrogenase nickel incorporation protein HypA/HybF